MHFLVASCVICQFGSSAKEDLIVDRVNPMNSIPNLGSHASSSGSYSVTTGAPSEVQKWKAPRTPLSIGVSCRVVWSLPSEPLPCGGHSISWLQGSLQPSSLEDKRASTETWSEEVSGGLRPSDLFIVPPTPTPPCHAPCGGVYSPSPSITETLCAAHWRIRASDPGQ